MYFFKNLPPLPNETFGTIMHKPGSHTQNEDTLDLLIVKQKHYGTFQHSPPPYNPFHLGNGCSQSHRTNLEAAMGQKEETLLSSSSSAAVLTGKAERVILSPLSSPL